MTLPAASRFQFTPDLSICRVLNGMWQVSGAHGRIDRARALDEMFVYHDAGFTSWDLADHYGPAEDFVGEFRRRFAARYGEGRLGEIQAFTKWVPHPGRMTRAVVEAGGRRLVVADRRRSARSVAIPLVGLRRPRLSRRAEASRRSARRRKNPSSRH